MNFEISRVYREIIESVTGSLLQESEGSQMSPQEIYDLKAIWSRKLREMTMPTETSLRYGKNETIMPSYLANKNKFADKTYDSSNEIKGNVDFYENTTDSLSDSAEDSDQRLEAQCPNYMMCLYSKVDKSKHKWKVKLKQGFLNVGKMEYAFDHAQGDLTW